MQSKRYREKTKTPRATGRGMGGEDRRPGAAPPRNPGTVRILLRDWPLDNARSIQKLSYRITRFDQGINRLLAGTG